MSGNPSGRRNAAGIEAWRDALRDRAFVVEFSISAVVSVPVFVLTMRFLSWVETREGVALPDPVHALLAPVDLTWLTFVLIYGGLLGALVVLLRRPRLLLLGGQAYLVLTLLRIVCMWVTPLAPPARIIPLTDPFVQGMAGTERVMLRDLFFSGHTSLPFLIALVAPRRAMRWTYVGLAAAIGALVVLQHVHYTIDVLAAPAASTVCWLAIRRLRPRQAKELLG